MGCTMQIFIFAGDGRGEGDATAAGDRRRPPGMGAENGAAEPSRRENGARKGERNCFFPDFRLFFLKSGLHERIENRSRQDYNTGAPGDTNRGGPVAAPVRTERDENI